jgi:hypothetical protein
MSARLIRVSLASAIALFATPAMADDVSVHLTEQPEPDDTPWEDPARFALTIDPNGPDKFSAQVNLEAELDLAPQKAGDPVARSKTAGAYLRWNRETGADDRQNNLEAGFNFKIGHDMARRLDLTDAQVHLTPEQRDRLARRRERPLDFSTEFSTGYARTAKYADLTTPACVATPSLAQCSTQFNESLRSGVAVGVFTPSFEGLLGRWAYSFEPKLGLDHDLLFNSPVDVDTGLASKGGYLSGVVGAALVITPEFVDPNWELKTSFQVRQRLAASDSRRPSIDATAERFEASATYFFLRPSDGVLGGWRAGIGVTYVHGGDPLTGAPKGDKIVIAFKLGEY